MRQLHAGELKIGASDSVLSSYLLPFLESYHKEHPEIIIQVTNKTTYESLRLLKKGSVDICFVNLPLPCAVQGFVNLITASPRFIL